MACRSTDQPSEEHILKVASNICMLSPRNIVLIGGGAVLPQTTGYKRLRCRSNDLDFVVNDVGLFAARNAYPFEKDGVNDLDQQADNLYCMDYEALHLGLFHNGVRGYQLNPQIFGSAIPRPTPQGLVYLALPEINMALKIRRGLMKQIPHIYGKDGLDFATLVVGLHKQGNEFDVRRLREYLNKGVCSQCTLGYETACINGLQKTSVQNLPQADRPYFMQTLNSCQQLLAPFCKYVDHYPKP